MDEFLKEAMRERGWSIPRLAEACDKNPGLVARWVSPNTRYRVMPGPESCVSIADALSVDPDYVLELAGHRVRRNGVIRLPDVQLQAINSWWDALPELIRAAIYTMAERFSNGNVIHESGPSYAPVVAA